MAVKTNGWWNAVNQRKKTMAVGNNGVVEEDSCKSSGSDSISRRTVQNPVALSLTHENPESECEQSNRIS